MVVTSFLNFNNISETTNERVEQCLKTSIVPRAHFRTRGTILENKQCSTRSKLSAWNIACFQVLFHAFSFVKLFSLTPSAPPASAPPLIEVRGSCPFAKKKFTGQHLSSRSMVVTSIRGGAGVSKLKKLFRGLKLET